MSAHGTCVDAQPGRVTAYARVSVCVCVCVWHALTNVSFVHTASSRGSPKGPEGLL